MTLLTISGRLRPPFFIFAALTSATTTVQADWGDYAPYVRVESMTYSEPVTIKSAFNEWKGDFEGGERQWTHNTLEAGVETARWSLGVFYRKDYDLRFRPDTADAYYKVQNQQDLTPGKTYLLDLRAQSFEAKGLRGTFALRPADSLRARVGLSIFEASALIDGSIRGQGSALTTDSYNYDARVDYHYSEDLLFDRQVTPPSGWGAALDLRLDGEFTPWVRGRMRVDDLFGQIWWRDTPYTRATASSDREHYDAEGNVSFDPLISGFEGVDRHHTQTLSPRLSGSLDFGPKDGTDGVLGIQHQYDQTLLGVGFASTFLSGAFRLLVWPEIHTLSLGYAKGRYLLELATDSLSPSEARSFWLRLRMGQV